jgi:hypothetical protein
LLVLVTGILSVQASIMPARAEALPNPCSLIPDPAARKLCKLGLKNTGKALPGIGPVVGNGLPGIPSPGEVITSAAEDALEKTMHSFVRLASDGVLEVLGGVFGAVQSSSQFNPTKKWYLQIYAMLFAFATIMAVGGVYKRWALALKNQNPNDIGRSIVEFVFFFLLCSSLPWTYKWLVHTGDNGIAPGFMDLVGKDAAGTMKGIRTDFNDALDALDVGKSIILPVLYLAGGLVGALVTEVMLFGRDGMMFCMLAAWVVVHGAHVGRFATDETFARTVMGNVALILFLPILTVVLVIAMRVFSSGDGVRILLLGSIMLMLVPFIAYKAYKRISAQDFEVMPAVRAGVGAGRTLRRRFTTS